MRSEKILVDLFKKFVSVVYEECNKNPDFAQKVDQVLAEVPKTKKGHNPNKKKTEVVAEAIPELYNEWHAREEVDFTMWLLEHSVPVLQATIRSYELDVRKQAAKWKDSKKLADLIVDKLRTKAARGSAFIRTSDNIQHEKPEENLKE